MKAVVSIIAVLLVGISALPQTTNLAEPNFADERLVTDAIASAIEDLSQDIRDAGLDPYYIARDDAKYALPVPVIFNAAGFVEELLFTGLSNIIIERIDFGVLTARLRLTINLPALEATLGKAEGNAIFFGNKYEASASGALKITNVRVAADASISISIIWGISVSRIDINFSIGGIEANTNIVIQGVDYSSRLNTLLGATIPNTLNEYSADLDQLLSIWVKDVINDIL